MCQLQNRRKLDLANVAEGLNMIKVHFVDQALPFGVGGQ